MKDELWNELALEALTKHGSGINVSATLDIAHPETIRNYRSFGEMLADAYRKGAASVAAPVGVSLEKEPESTSKSPDDVVPDHYTISLDGGKYKVIRNFGEALTFYRGGELWEAGNEQWGHAKCIGSMVYRIAELEMAIGQVLEGSLDRNLRRNADGLNDYIKTRTNANLMVGLSYNWQRLLRTALDKK